MEDAVLRTTQGNWGLARASNSSGDSDPAPTNTEPTGSGVLTPVSNNKPYTINQIILMPFGTNAANLTFTMKVFGWAVVANSAMWVPVLLSSWTCTNGAAVGVSGQKPANTDFMADTVVKVQTGLEAGNGLGFSNGLDVGGFVVVDVLGFSKVQVNFTLGSATGANALYRLI